MQEYNKKVTGSVQEKNGQWYMVMNFYDSEGKRKQKWRSTGLSSRGNKKKAQKLLEDELAKCNEEEDNTIEYFERKNSLLFSDYIKEWLVYQNKKVESSTYCSDAITVNKHLLPYFTEEEILLKDVNSTHINEYFHAKRKGIKGAKPLSETSLRRHCATIVSILNKAIDEGYIQKKAIVNIARPKADTKRIEVYDEEQIQELLELLEKTNSKLLVPVMLAAFFGLRREEVSGLKEANLDFRNHRLYIETSVTTGYLYDETTGQYKTTKFHNNKLKSDASRRSFVLFPEIENYLKEVLETKRMYMKIFGNTYNTEYIEYVFVHENGNLITPDYLTHTFGKFIKKNKLPHLTFHGLRHSSASLLLSKGYNIREVQEWLGHGSYDITAKIYAHVYPKTKIEMSNTIAQCFKIKKDVRNEEEIG